MKKGISVWSFVNKSLKECFALAKDAGYDGVEVAIAEDGEINLDSTYEDILKIKEDAKNAGIELYSVASILFWKYSLTANDEKTREKAKNIVRKQLEVASWLGCDTILVVPGAVEAAFTGGTEIIPYDVVYNRSLEALLELKEDAERLKVNIGIENVWNKFLVSPVEMKEFIEKINSEYVGAYFDVGNILNIGYPDHWIKILGDKIKKIHIKDFKKDVGTLSGFVDLLNGDVDFPAVTKALKEIGYDGWCTAEMGPYKIYPETVLYNTINAMNKIFE